ncbi:hypothetical protein PS854_02754 [Pseudomonas fluorescens]|jgi:predicted esterase YcpF (UPF0227 family)|uniref:Uncharacterized protein n=1 Tax=Pseudomonas fluorescens TaxID=294 RepID=A0A5E7KHB4_PSEFL|nr:hypothetical protein PS854_02754 [Pseudomonas fluorescens]
MTQTAAVSVASPVRQLAKDHPITADPDGMSRMAVTITRRLDSGYVVGREFGGYWAENFSTTLWV